MVRKHLPRRSVPEARVVPKVRASYAAVVVGLTIVASVVGGIHLSGQASARGVSAFLGSSGPKVVANITVGSEPNGVAYDSRTGEVFVANTGSGNVSVVCDGGPYCGADMKNKVVGTIAVGSNPYGATYDSAKGEIFVTHYNSAGSVAVISDSTDKVLTTVPVGDAPAADLYDPGAGEVFASNFGSGNVSVISDATNKVVANVGVGDGPYQMAYDSAKGEIFVPSEDSSNVSVICDGSSACGGAADLNKVVAVVALPTGSIPSGAGYDGARGEVFVACDVGHGNVSVISDATNAVVATVPVGSGSSTAVYDSMGEVYAPNYDSAAVSVISAASNSVVATIGVGMEPAFAAYDPSQSEVFVSNYGSGNVTVIWDGSTPSTPGSSSSGSFLGLSASEGFAVGALLGVVVGLAVGVGVGRLLLGKQRPAQGASAGGPPAPPPGASP
jgi:YVTN family beta-propeller protein